MFRTIGRAETTIHCRVPSSSASTSIVNPGGIFGRSRGSSLALQSGQGIPGTPHAQARGRRRVQQSEGRSSCASQFFLAYVAARHPDIAATEVRHGGAPLLYGYPITRSRTFKPSGDPQNDPPEAAKESDYEEWRRERRLNTPAGRDAYDASLRPEHVAEVLRANAYWEAIRFNPSKPGKGKG
jgi:hypothetical protein